MWQVRLKVPAETLGAVYLGSDSSLTWLRVRNEMSKLPEQQSAKNSWYRQPKATAAYEGVA